MPCNQQGARSVSKGTTEQRSPQREHGLERMTEKTMQTSLRGIANKAAEQKRYRFRDLYRLLNEENLRESFYLLRKNAACGVDGVSFCGV